MVYFQLSPQCLECCQTWSLVFPGADPGFGEGWFGELLTKGGPSKGFKGPPWRLTRFLEM